MCERLWEELRAGPPPTLPATVRLVAVVRDAQSESPARLRAASSRGVPVVMSSVAWSDYAVPATPYFVYLVAGRVQGEGSASGWAQILSLLRDATADHVDPHGTGDVDHVLATAGIEPGHPSLYPAGRPDGGERS